MSCEVFESFLYREAGDGVLSGSFFLRLRLDFFVGPRRFLVSILEFGLDCIIHLV